MSEENCPTCGKKIEEKFVEKKVGDKEIKFCTDGCAKAYEEIRHKREEVKPGGKNFL
ncbi:MAG: hypothetical protein H5T50_08020 [Nitrososphaeria archaeon]|nr:hypothetical protein [Nitrososphaeria archaeon]